MEESFWKDALGKRISISEQLDERPKSVQNQKKLRKLNEKTLSLSDCQEKC